MATKKRLVDIPAAPPSSGGWGERWLAAASGAGRARLEKGRALVALAAAEEGPELVAYWGRPAAMSGTIGASEKFQQSQSGETFVMKER